MIFIHFISSRSTMGIINFKIDTNNKRVIRESERFKYRTSRATSLFDSKKLEFKEFNYIDIKDFFGIFESKSKNELTNYFKKQYTFRINLKIKLRELQKGDLTKKEVFRNWVESKVAASQKANYYFRAFPQEDGVYTCSIFWKTKPIEKNKPSKNFKNANKKTFTKLSKGPFIAISFLVKPHFFTNEIKSKDIDSLLDKLDIKRKEAYYFQGDATFSFVIKKPIGRKLKNIKEAIDSINQNFNLEKLVDSCGAVEFRKVIDKQELDLLWIKTKYILFNIKNNRDFEFNYWTLKTNVMEEFSQFKDSYNLFIERSEQQPYTIQRSNVINLLNPQSKSDTYFVSANYSGISKQTLEFFTKIPYLRFRYELDRVNLVINNQKQRALSDLNSQAIVSISEENFLHYQAEVDANTGILIYSLNEGFFSQNLSQKIKEFRSNENTKNKLGLYLDQIDKTTINIINLYKVDFIVVGKNISDNLYNERTFFETVSLTNVARQQKMQVFFETNKEYENYILKKAEMTHVIQSSTNV
ncbi:hypothetical protein K4L35_00035 [Mycoplasma sp. Ms02]|nr:hypothetical protein [Mycoplasma sp. Ms02]QZE12371.1 hypothetical protein K4L35_00035 [Mycoplasma sp. Ms02]